MEIKNCISYTMFGIILVLALSATNVCSATVEEEIPNRDAKTFDLLSPIFSLFGFENTPCLTDTQDNLVTAEELAPAGICYSQKECVAINGVANGLCAQGFGVCCVVSADVTIRESGEYFSNPQYPAGYAEAGVVTATLLPSDGTVQIFLEIEDMILMSPIEGDCGNDSFVVDGGNPGLEVPIICGDNRGQHMYIDIDNSDGPYKLIIFTSAFSFERTWKVKVTFYSEPKAPQRCLQYFTETSGSFSSFNYCFLSQAINNHKYSICFGYVAGFCDIGINFERLDLGNYDNWGNGHLEGVTVGYNNYCGDLVNYSVTANVTGPIIVTVKTDDANLLEEEGFLADYTMLPCT